MSGNDHQEEPQETMTFMEHLEELRQRLIRCLLAVVAGFVVCWFFREELRQFLEAPLYTAWNSVPGLPAPSPLSFTSLMEPFVAYLKIAGIGGIFFASPVIFYHLWRFVSPGLYKKEKKMALPFVFISSALFVVGSAGAYAYVFPMGFSFFLQFSSGGTVDVYDSGRIAPVEKTASAKPPRKSPAKSLKQSSVKGAKSKAKHSATPKMATARKTQRSATHDSGQNKWDKVHRLYTWVEKKLTGESCGQFGARETDAGVLLRFRFAENRCGKRPVSMNVSRSGASLPLSLKLVSESKGALLYEALDTGKRHRTVTYQLHVVREAAQKLLPVLMVKDYLDFAVKLMLAFGLVFELPILIFFLGYAGIVDYMQLIRFGRWFVVLSLVVAAILTPPDVVTQILLATPLIVLYYLSIGVVFFLGRKRGRNK